MTTPELTYEQRQVFGEYITRQKDKGRTKLGMEELGFVIEAIRIAMPALAAAADVGLPTADDVKGILKPDWLHPPTIERCAQKCDELARAAEAESDDEEINAITDAFAQAAAAIRTLKDKP